MNADALDDDLAARRLLAGLLTRAARDAAAGDALALDWLSCPWACQTAEALGLGCWPPGDDDLAALAGRTRRPAGADSLGSP